MDFHRPQCPVYHILQHSHQHLSNSFLENCRVWFHSPVEVFLCPLCPPPHFVQAQLQYGYHVQVTKVWLGLWQTFFLAFSHVWIKPQQYTQDSSKPSMNYSLLSSNSTYSKSFLIVLAHNPFSFCTAAAFTLSGVPPCAISCLGPIYSSCMSTCWCRSSI